MQNIVFPPTGIAVGASQTAQIVSKPFQVADRKCIRIAIIASSVTVTTAITAKLQHHNGAAWVAVGDQGQVSITADGTFEIRMIETDSSDAAQLPLYPMCRVVVDTGSGDAVTIDGVYV